MKKDIMIYVVGATHTGKSTLCEFIAEKIREFSCIPTSVVDLDDTKIKNPSVRISQLENVNQIVIQEVCGSTKSGGSQIDSFRIDGHVVLPRGPKPVSNIGDIIVCKRATIDNWYRNGDRMLVRSEPFLYSDGWGVHVSQLNKDGSVTECGKSVWVDISQFDVIG